MELINVGLMRIMRTSDIDDTITVESIPTRISIRFQNDQSIDEISNA